MLTKLKNFNRHNRFVLIVNFHNRFDKALRKIFQFCRALSLIENEVGWAVFTTEKSSKSTLSKINNFAFITDKQNHYQFDFRKQGNLFKIQPNEIKPQRNINRIESAIDVQTAGRGPG